MWQAKSKQTKPIKGTQLRPGPVELFDISLGPIQNILNNVDLDPKNKYLHVSCLRVESNPVLNSHKDTLLSFYSKIGDDAFDTEKCLQVILRSNSKSPKKLRQIERMEAMGYDIGLCQEAKSVLCAEPEVAVDSSVEGECFFPTYADALKRVEGVIPCTSEDGDNDSLNDMFATPSSLKRGSVSVSEGESLTSFKITPEVDDEADLIAKVRLATEESKPRRKYPALIGNVLDDCLCFIKKFEQ